MSKIKITIICLIVICTAANVMAGCYLEIRRVCGGCGKSKMARQSVSCSNTAHGSGTSHGYGGTRLYECSKCRRKFLNAWKEFKKQRYEERKVQRLI